MRRRSETPPTDHRLDAGILLSALSVLPHAWHLPLAVVAAFFISAAVRRAFWPKIETAPPRALRLLLVAVGLVLVVQQAGLTDSRRFGVSLLVVMAGLKLLETTRKRDLYTLAFLGLFVLATQFLFSTSIVLTAWVLLLTVGWIAFLAVVESPGLGLRSALRTAGLLVAGALPVMVLLFVLFPRLDGPLWRLQLGGDIAYTGMSDRLHMGSIASLGRLETVAFRVRFHGEPPPPAERYWRGLVLWHTDGRNWKRVERPRRPAPTEFPPGALVQEITLEPTGQRWLFALEEAVGADPGLQLDADATLGTTAPLKRRFTYRVASRPPQASSLDAATRRLGLQLPPRVSPRVKALARRWRQNAGDDLAVIRAALDHFRREPFVYTLHPGRLEGDPVDGFLFETRQGFCEHYAAAFVLLMRLAGVPARVVVGYLGGETNPVSGHLVVRHSDAHAWAEVWLPGRGWTRVDPTAAVAPERVEQGPAPQPAPLGTPVRFRLTADFGPAQRLLRRLGWYRDSLQLAWHYWVVGYDRNRQRNLLQRLGLGRLEGTRLALAAVLSALAAGVLVFALRRPSRHENRDPAVAAWRRFRRRLQRAGVRLPRHMGPLDTATTAARRFPARSEEFHAIATLYARLRYGRHNDAADLNELRRRIRRLRL